VVVASSIEKAARRHAAGRSAVAGGSIAGKAVPRGNCSSRKALQVIVVRRADGATLFEQVRRRQTGFAARRFECLGLAAVAVGLVEQLVENRQELGRQREGLEFSDHALDGQGLLALLFETGEGRLENFGRSLAEAALALAMEIDRRRMQGQQQRRRFDRRGDVTEVLVGKIRKRKLAVTHTLPEKIGLDAGGQRLGLIEQSVGSRFIVAQQDVRRLDLAALAGGRLDLQRAVVVGHNGGRLEGPVFFE
jgi:hypothetical protein